MPSDGPGVGPPYSSRTFLPWKRQGLPSSWGTPISICTCSSTPVGRRPLTRTRRVTRPPLKRQRRLQRINPLTRLNSMAFGLAVYASQCRLPEHHARLASDCRLRFVGWDWPTGFLRKVSVHDVMKHPPFPSFSAQLSLNLPVRKRQSDYVSSGDHRLAGYRASSGVGKTSGLRTSASYWSRP